MTQETGGSEIENEGSPFAENPWTGKGAELKKPAWLYRELPDRLTNEKAGIREEG